MDAESDRRTESPASDPQAEASPPDPQESGASESGTADPASDLQGTASVPLGPTSASTGPPSPGRFAVALFAIVVVVALLADLPMAWALGNEPAPWRALENGVRIGGIFAVIYYVGNRVMAILDAKR